MDLLPVGRSRAGAALLLALVAAGCRDGGPQTGTAAAAVEGPLGVPHEQYVQAGPTPPGIALAPYPNPLEGDPTAIARGERLFVQYNCVVCHGSGGGGGGMGPSLNDDRWRYGSSAAEIFQSIYEGRPLGMPRWGGRITDEQIWILVAYLRSLSPEEGIETVTWPGIPSRQEEGTQG